MWRARSGPITASWVRPAAEVRGTLRNYVREHAHLHDYVQEDDSD